MYIYTFSKYLLQHWCYNPNSGNTFSEIEDFINLKRDKKCDHLERIDQLEEFRLNFEIKIQLFCEIHF